MTQIIISIITRNANKNNNELKFEFNYVELNFNMYLRISKSALTRRLNFCSLYCAEIDYKGIAYKLSK